MNRFACAALGFLIALSLAAPGAQVADAPAAKPAEAAEHRLARWQESLELDLAGEVVAEGRALVHPGGALAADARALALYARALAATGGGAEARRLLESSGAAAPQEWIAAERARLLLEEDDQDGALALLWDPAANAMRSPALPLAHWIAGRARARRGEWELAAPLLERFVELEPRAAEAASAWHLLAQAALKRGDAERAKECAAREEALGKWHAFYRARRLQIREHPREPLPRLGLAQLWLEAGEPARARAVLQELLALAPDFARGWMALGEAQRKLGDLGGARASYDRALELDPALDVARYNRAVIAKLQSRPADARRDLELLLAGPAANEPRFAGAHLDLARILNAAGEQSAALAAYARYRELGGREKL